MFSDETPNLSSTLIEDERLIRRTRRGSECRLRAAQPGSGNLASSFPLNYWRRENLRCKTRYDVLRPAEPICAGVYDI
jgi:hypothetical protein